MEYCLSPQYHHTLQIHRVSLGHHTCQQLRKCQTSMVEHTAEAGTVVQRNECLIGIDLIGISGKTKTRTMI